MAKLNLDRVLGHYTESIKADKEYENGALVGKGLLVEGEDRLYEAVEATADNHFLVSTPEIDFTASSTIGKSSIDYKNSKGEHMRAHQLEKGDTVTVEQKLHAAGLAAGDKVGVAGGQFAKDEAGDYVVEVVKTIGADRRPAYRIRKVK